MSSVTFALLFQPWLSASGSGGEVRSDAFGRVTGVTNGFDEWSISKFREMNISGAWGLLAAAAAVVTVFAAVAQVRSRSRALAALVMGSSVAVTVLVLICLLYLDAKGPELRTLIDPGEGFGSGWLRRIFDEDGTAVSAGEQRMAGAGLTPVALLAGVLSSAAAVAAVAQGTRRYGLSTMRALSWLVTPLPTETTPPPAAAEAPRPAAQPTPDAAERVLWDELVFDDDLIANITWVRNTNTPESETSAHRSAPVLTR
ncbi:hypothetical protein [Nocardia arthritidis]|uniref:hypothetical protein n=1 Tax=Nocardia arthritidis TaxID=228602 RepID=UPI0012EE490F|nr:hypothetical protein [Nocardia arthritidis]